MRRKYSTVEKFGLYLLNGGKNRFHEIESNNIITSFESQIPSLELKIMALKEDISICENISEITGDMHQTSQLMSLAKQAKNAYIDARDNKQYFSTLI